MLDTGNEFIDIAPANPSTTIPTTLPIRIEAEKSSTESIQGSSANQINSTAHLTEEEVENPWDDYEYPLKTRDQRNGPKYKRRKKVYLNRGEANPVLFDHSDCEEISFQDLKRTLEFAHIPNSNIYDPQKGDIQTPYYIHFLQTHFDSLRILRDSRGRHRVEIHDASTIDWGLLFEKLDQLNNLPGVPGSGRRKSIIRKTLKGSTDVLKATETAGFGSIRAVCTNIESYLDKAHSREFPQEKRRKLNRRSRARVANRLSQSSNLNQTDLEFSHNQAGPNPTPAMIRAIDSKPKSPDQRLLKVLERVRGRREISPEVLLAMDALRDKTQRRLYINQGGYNNSKRARVRRKSKLHRLAEKGESW